MEKIRSPLISVLVPVYNTEQYLARCLNSLIFQEYYNIEIVIINDGSTDSSLNIINDYANKDNRIVVISQENEGLSAALNNGLYHCTGEWIYFVDSDDWIDLDGLKGLVDMVIKYPQVELIRCYNRKVSSDELNTPNEAHSEEVLYNRDNFLDANKIGGYASSLFVQREIILSNNLKFSLDLKIKMDLEITFKCVAHCKWILVYHKIFYNYYVRRSSLSRTFSYDKTLNHLLVAEKVYRYSIQFQNNSIRNVATMRLNDGLTCFISDMGRFYYSEDFHQKPKIIRNIIRNYMKNTNFKFSNMTLKNKIFTLIALIDFRILGYLWRLKHLKI